MVLSLLFYRNFMKIEWRKNEKDQRATKKKKKIPWNFYYYYYFRVGTLGDGKEVAF